MPPAAGLPRCLAPCGHGLAGPAAPHEAATPSLTPSLLADGSGPAVQQTRVRVAWDDEALHVRFDCEDRDAWGTFERPDDPIYEEEAVEGFLAAGTADPVQYFEFQGS